MLLSKKSFDSKRSTFSGKVLKFLYSHLIALAQTAKVNGVTMSQNVLENLKWIMRKKIFIYHLHVTGEITGYAHSFCNVKGRENYYKIPVITHSLFKFCFSFSLKGLRRSVWGTKDIGIGGSNAANINFANIGNQVMFLDTIRYFQQCLETLGSNLTDKEKNSLRTECKKFLQKMKFLLKNLILSHKTIKSWCSIIYQQTKEQFHM